MITTAPSWGITSDGCRYSPEGVEDSRAHSRYLTLSPDDLIPAFEKAGWSCETVQNVMSAGDHARSRARAILSVWEPGTRLDGREYAFGCHILLDHTGKSAVKLRGGVIRVACANQFHAPAFSFRHCANRIREFAANPVEFAREAIHMTRDLPERIEALKGVGRCDWLQEAFRTARPRLAATASDSIAFYRRQSGRSDAWAFVQGLTAARTRRGRGRRPPVLAEIASRVVRLPEAVLWGDAPIVPGVFDGAVFN